MKEVEVSYDVTPPAQEILSYMTPRRIIEAAEIYEIRSHESTENGANIDITFDETDMTVVFTELENGYEYVFTDSENFFAHRASQITVTNGDETTVTARTEYSFDSFWSFIMDWLGAKRVRNELAMTIANLANEASNGPAGEAIRTNDEHDIRRRG